MWSIIKIKQTLFILFFIIFTDFPFNDVTNGYLKITWVKEIVSYFYQVIWFLCNWKVLLILRLQKHVWKLILLRNRCCYYFKLFFIWGTTFTTAFFVFNLLVGLRTFEFIIALKHSWKMRWQTDLFNVNRFLLDLI